MAMNDPVKIERFRSCYKCGYHASTPATVCPQCRSTLFTDMNTRIRGGLLVVIGLILVGMMSYILLWSLAAFSNSNTLNARFTGTEQQKILIIFLFGILILFGLASCSTGFWQLIFGRRNKVFVWSMYGMAVLISLGGGLVFLLFN